MKEERQHLIMRKLEIDAGHRIMGHQGPCRWVHGHRYAFEIYATVPKLNELEMVIDFRIIKQEIGSWLNENWDHAMLLYEQDPLLELWRCGPLRDHKHFALPSHPTIEHLCEFLLGTANRLLRDTPVEIFRVAGWETPNSYAIVEKKREVSHGF